MEKYPSWTYQIIADMTPFQQMLALRPKPESKTIEFATEEEYSKWLTSRR